MFTDFINFHFKDYLNNKYLTKLILFFWITELHSFSNFVLCCYHCKGLINNNTEDLLNHCRLCKNVRRLDQSYRYVCYNCDYHSYNSNNMRKHIRRHTGDKPYTCQFCHAQFAENVTLKKHISVKHVEPSAFALSIVNTK